MLEGLIIIGSLIGGIAALIYACHLHQKQQNFQPIKEVEEWKFVESFMKLGYSYESTLRYMKRYTTIDQLVKANKKIEKALRKAHIA